MTASGLNDFINLRIPGKLIDEPEIKQNQKSKLYQNRARVTFLCKSIEFGPCRFVKSALESRIAELAKYGDDTINQVHIF